MTSFHLKTLVALSSARRIAGGIVAVVAFLLLLAGLAFRLLVPVDAGAGRVQPDRATGTDAMSVSLLVSRTHARVAQYALSATMADQKKAEDSAARLGQVIAMTTASGRDDEGVAALAGRYRASVERTFAAVELRRVSVDRILSAGTAIRTITSAIVLALAAETDTNLVRGGMTLAQSFEESDAAAARFLSSRTPADSNIAVRTLAIVPIEAEGLARLAGGNRRIGRFVAALEKPLVLYAEALQGVVAANEQLRVEAGERDAASDAVLAAAADGRDRAVRSDRVVLAIDTGFVLLFLFMLLPVLVGQFRRLKTAKAALRNKSLMLETTLSSMDQGLIMVTPECTVGVFNDRALKLLDLPAELMREGVPFDDVVDYQRERGELADRADDGCGVEQQGRLPADVLAYQRQRPDGTALEIRSVPLPGGGMVRTYTDVTQLRLAEKRLIHAARHDALTNLPNRAVFSKQLGEAVSNAERADTGFAVLFLDLNRFKLVNDTLGHAAGDELLQQAAGRMRAEVRETDTLARLGGDEFALVMPGVHDPGAAMAAAERLRCSVSEPYSLSQGTARIGVSIGISCHPIHGCNADDLLNRADLALYRAKSASRNMCCVFDGELDNRRQDELDLEGALRLALQEEQFQLVYQVISDIRTRRIVGAEALLRWHHPTKGIIPPLKFIPLAERTGLIVDLGRGVLETACREAFNWAIPISVSVNVAPAQLRRKAIVTEVRDLLATTGLPPARLKLEVTERQLLEETAEIFATMTALRDLGVGLVLDDFGTGYSSLSTLRSYPFSDVKIDRSFMEGIVRDERSRGLIESILQVCRVLELNCVAEGVETEEQFTLLSGLGCTHVQGYLIGRPESPSQIRRRLRRVVADQRQGSSEALPDEIFEMAGCRRGTPS
jgi:diguanylate cyclase (GGDEF)-like protein